MSKQARVVWTEGLFLRPEHLQQCERYQDRQREAQRAMLHACGWGLSSYELEADLLGIGKLALRSASGVFPDGMVFSMPADDPLPPPREIGSEVRDQTVYLGLPLRAANAVEFGREAEGGSLHRYRIIAEEVGDVTGTAADAALIELGPIEPRLLLESEPRESYACIPVARVVEVTADKAVKLDEQFIPTVLASRSARTLDQFIKELHGMVHQRAEAIAARVAGGGSSTADISDFLMLQVLNRSQPLLEHFGGAVPVHPELLFRELVALAGELASFAGGSRRPESFPAYEHDRLSSSFFPVFAALRGALSGVLEQTAIPIPVKEKNYGVRVAVVNDKSLYSSANFVLAVKADLPAEQISRGLPAQAKIGPVEKIRDLVNLQLPGIGINPLSAAPRQIPYHAGFSYFQMDSSAKLWAELGASGGIAMYFSGELPGLSVELWAVRHG